jgi:hypothetical protein
MIKLWKFLRTTQKNRAKIIFYSDLKKKNSLTYQQSLQVEKQIKLIN